MYNGIAIYGSALGNEFALARKPSELSPMPVTYFIISNGQSAHQLGRIVRLQQLLGELRLTALLDRDTIKKLGGPIRQLEGLVSRRIGFGTQFGTVGRKEFDEVASLYTKIGAKCHGGLIYRMSRSEYYYESLLSRISHMKYEEIEGWQSYDTFIYRHFEQQFRSMHAVGNRYKEIGTKIERLMSIYNFERQRKISTIPIIIASCSLLLAAIVNLAGPTVQNLGEYAGVTIMILCAITFFAIIYALFTAGNKNISDVIAKDQQESDAEIGIEKL